MEVDVLYSKKVNCPICNKEFITSKMRSSRVRINKIDGDFMTHYKSENPIKYHVFVCPKCGYAAMESTFTTIKADEKVIIRENVTSRWKEREFSGPRSDEDAIQCYKLALYCGQLLNLKKYELGSISLRIAWFNRLIEHNDEKRFLQNSVDLFEQAFHTEHLSAPSMDEITLGYLIGELHRRLGRKKEAIQWFGKTISNPFIKTNPRIEKLTREQWLLVKEE